MSSNKYTQKYFKQDLESLEQLIGGKKIYNSTYRNFKIVELNGKAVNFDYGASIKENQTPLNASKKLLKSICLSMGLKGMKKLQCNVTFVIKETTQGSKKNMYGPYKGKYTKYTPEEAKKAKASGIQFKMKPIVKLFKKETLIKLSDPTSLLKGGGSYICTYCGHEHFKHPYYSISGKCGGCGFKENDLVFDGKKVTEDEKARGLCNNNICEKVSFVSKSELTNNQLKKIQNSNRNKSVSKGLHRNFGSKVVHGMMVIATSPIILLGSPMVIAGAMASFAKKGIQDALKSGYKYICSYCGHKHSNNPSLKTGICEGCNNNQNDFLEQYQNTPGYHLENDENGLYIVSKDSKSCRKIKNTDIQKNKNGNFIFQETIDNSFRVVIKLILSNTKEELKYDKNGRLYSATVNIPPVETCEFERLEFIDVTDLNKLTDIQKAKIAYIYADRQKNIREWRNKTTIKLI